MAQYPSGINPADYPEPFAGLYRQHLQHLSPTGINRPLRSRHKPATAESA
jgi:hypothetical protein